MPAARKPARRQPAAREPARPQPAREPAGAPAGAPGSPSLRAKVEQRSAPVLAWLSLRPRLLLPGLVLVLLLASGALPAAVGAVCLLLVLVVVGWLSYLSWPVLPARARSLRVLVLLMMAGLAVGRLLQ